MNLKDLRKSHKFSLEEMAKKLVITNDAYLKKENCQREFTIDQLKQLSLIFNLYMEDIYECVLLSRKQTEECKQEVKS